MRLEGKRALVLGASSPDGMGAAVARRFLAEGAKVVLAGRDPAKAQAVAAETSAKRSTKSGSSAATSGPLTGSCQGPSIRYSGTASAGEAPIGIIGRPPR